MRAIETVQFKFNIVLSLNNFPSACLPSGLTLPAMSVAFDLNAGLLSFGVLNVFRYWIEYVGCAGTDARTGFKPYDNFIK